MHDHQPVLLNEVLEALAIKPNGIYVDGTFGRGGHSLAILQRLGPEGRLLALDKDPESVAAGKTGPFRDPRFCIVHGSFTVLEKAVQDRGWHGKVNGVLLDLGVSSPQVDDAKRGFSFVKDGPLDMRMNPGQGMDAATWINQASETEIRQVIFEFGEERFAKRIARFIVNAREQTPITRTAQLSEIVRQAVPKWEPKKHPATRTFQAIRIFINRELDELQNCLPQCVDVMATGGRLCVISFHSLEDRIVKQFIQRESHGEQLPRDLPVKAAELSHRLKKVGALIKPSKTEITTNPRARSACLRIAEKLL
jgi:16S rRNA (cytosine1402-N4)-methyltransferase